ncbi:carbohydrate ABC transporter permease [Lacisediminimonas profundi]|uniref:carbohydrate ABC transporter permease n=1 Tax=Lacisediminimonas profundi TaxID=2603856 RepID=UPI001F4FBF66|nr:carbohydrate ABC transporter permease [Lacisediminimonas profundi]
MTWRQRHPKWLGDVATLILLLLVLYPLFWLIQVSFRPKEELFSSSFLFMPTLENYLALWKGNFPLSFINSIISSTAATILAMLFGVPAAYALSRGKFRSARQIGLWILVTRMAPPIAFTIPLYITYRYLDLHDTRTGLVIVYLTFSLALVIWMMKPFFDAIPRELEEAAAIDGCTTWQTFLKVTLPLAGPGLAATAVICFIQSWNDFFFALILTRTQASTAPVAIVGFIQYVGWEWGRMAAAGTLVMMPVVLFSIFVRKYLVHGLAAGSIKG